MATVNKRMDERGKRAKAAFQNQVKSHLDALGVQSGNMKQYDRELKQLSEDLKTTEKDIATNTRYLELAEKELKILSRPDAFDVLDDAPLKFEYETWPEYIQLTKDIRQVNMVATRDKYKFVIENLAKQADNIKKRAEAKRLDIASAKVVLKESKEFLDANNVEYNVEALEALFQDFSNNV